MRIEARLDVNFDGGGADLPLQWSSREGGGAGLPLLLSLSLFLSLSTCYASAAVESARSVEKCLFFVFVHSNKGSATQTGRERSAVPASVIESLTASFGT